MKRALIVVGYMGWILMCVGWALTFIVDQHATAAGTVASVGSAVLLAIAPAAIARMDPP